MANAVFVIPSKMPKLVVVDQLVKTAMRELFPNLLVDTIRSYGDIRGWLIVHPVESDLAFHIWVERYKRKPALSIPHRHCYEIMWWVEYELRERLARELDAKQYDEGIGPVDNLTVSYSTLSDYLTAVYPSDYAAVKIAIARDEASLLPSDLRDRCGALV